MNLPTVAVNEFQEIYQRKIGVVLSFDEAKIKAEGFLRLMELLTRKPIINQISNSIKNEKQ